MAKLICLQAGHQNTKNHCDPALRGSTGAPGEVEFTVKTRDRVKDFLLEKKNADGTPAFQVQLVDATFSCDPKADDTDYALFLSIHYEADVHGKDGGMISPPDPSVDVVYPESKRISDAIGSVYFPEAGIVNRPEWISNNMRFYYMWKFLSASTPCALIECGVGQNAHDKVILADTDRVAKAIVRGICKAFNVPYETVPPPPPPVDYKKKFEDEQKAHENTKKELTKANDRIKAIKDFVASA